MSTVIYLRGKSTPSNSDSDPLPRKGAPIGAIAYNVTGDGLEVAFSLLNKRDKWDRSRSRTIVLERLRLKRETSTKQFHSTQTGHSGEVEALPKFFRLNPPVQKEPLRPYDVLQLILNAVEDGQINLPAKVVRSIHTMLSDNEVRVRLLDDTRAQEHPVCGAV